MRRPFQITDTDDPEQVAKAQKLSEDEDEDIVAILKTARGRRWIAKLMFDTCHIMRVSYSPAGPGASDFNDGARSVGLAIWEEIRTGPQPELLSTLVEEYHG